MHLCHRYLQKRLGHGSENQSFPGVTTICLMQLNISRSHRVDQAVDCGLWNVISLIFYGCVKLLDIGGNWNMLSYTSTQSIPNMLNGWHVWVCRPWKNWDIFSFQELCTDPFDRGPCQLKKKTILVLWKTLLVHCVIKLHGNPMRTFGECSLVVTDVVHNILVNVRITFQGYFI